MARILRGDIVWADLDPVKGREQAGRRPVVVLSHDVFNERSGTVIAMALTSQPQRAGFPLVQELESVNVGKPAWVKISQIRTLSTRRLGKKLGRVAPEELQRLVEGLNEIITAQTPPPAGLFNAPGGHTAAATSLAAAGTACAGRRRRRGRATSGGGRE